MKKYPTTEVTCVGKVFEVSLKYKAVSEMAGAEQIDCPEKVIAYMKGTFDENPQVESVWVIATDTKHKPIGRQLITVGTATASLLHPREVYRVAILAGASNVFVVHNHPSGNPEPSKADLDMTRRLCEASKIIGINLADHVIIGRIQDDPMGCGWFSFATAGLI